jgi:two-component system CheB/CheR fusion protein
MKGNGFIEKPVPGDDLLAAIDGALERVRVRNELAQLRELAARHVDVLPPRQRQVMGLVIERKPSKEIAFLPGITRRTIENYRAAVMKNIGVRSLSQLILLTLEDAAPADGTASASTQDS